MPTQRQQAAMALNVMAVPCVPMPTTVCPGCKRMARLYGGPVCQSCVETSFPESG